MCLMCGSVSYFSSFLYSCANTFIESTERSPSGSVHNDRPPDALYHSIRHSKSDRTDLFQGVAEPYPYQVLLLCGEGEPFFGPTVNCDEPIGCSSSMEL